MEWYVGFGDAMRNKLLMSIMAIMNITNAKVCQGGGKKREETGYVWPKKLRRVVNYSNFAEKMHIKRRERARWLFLSCVLLLVDLGLKSSTCCFISLCIPIVQHVFSNIADLRISGLSRCWNVSRQGYRYNRCNGCNVA